jgi:hypothetical protein
MIILELLNINYMSLLSNMKFGSSPVIPDDDYDKHMAIYKYIASLYLIGIYMYSMYLTRYSLTEKQFDMLTNIDAEDVNSTKQIYNLLLQEYAKKMLSNFNSVYTTNELTEASKYIPQKINTIETTEQGNTSDITSLAGVSSLTNLSGVQIPNKSMSAIPASMPASISDMSASMSASMLGMPAIPASIPVIPASMPASISDMSASMSASMPAMSFQNNPAIQRLKE